MNLFNRLKLKIKLKYSKNGNMDMLKCHLQIFK